MTRYGKMESPVKDRWQCAVCYQLTMLPAISCHNCGAENEATPHPALVGYKAKPTEVDAGFFYCPYIPLAESKAPTPMQETPDPLDPAWPFPPEVSKLEKAAKQQALLDDAVVIYKLIRNPSERKVYYIDVGNMPTEKAEAYMAGIQKTETYMAGIRKDLQAKADQLIRKVESEAQLIEIFGKPYDPSVYDPMDMMGDFFFSKGTMLKRLEGSEEVKPPELVSKMIPTVYNPRNAQTTPSSLPPGMFGSGDGKVTL
jgi:hypothetical protein